MGFINKDGIASEILKTDSPIGLTVLKFPVDAFFEILNKTFTFVISFFANVLEDYFIGD